MSKPLGGKGMRRVEEAWPKAKLGEKMTQKEIKILQRQSSSCSACYAHRRTGRDVSTGRGER